MSTLERIRDEASLPRRNGELVFDAPWESRAFGVAVAFVDQGACAWEDFRSLLIAEIAACERDHEHAGEEWSYYERWLVALERLLVELAITTSDELEQRTAEVARAAHHEHKHDHEHEGGSHA